MASDDEVTRRMEKQRAFAAEHGGFAVMEIVGERGRPAVAEFRTDGNSVRLYVGDKLVFIAHGPDFKTGVETITEDRDPPALPR